MLARVLGALFAAMLAAPASAWDNFGHMEVAQIAWDLLNDNARTRVAQLIRLNHQYVAWTVNVVPEKRDQIAFLRAATWADYIKNAPHYIKDGTSDGNRPPAGREAGQNIGGDPDHLVAHARAPCRELALAAIYADNAVH